MPYNNEATMIAIQVELTRLGVAIEMLNIRLDVLDDTIKDNADATTLGFTYIKSRFEALEEVTDHLVGNENPAPDIDILKNPWDDLDKW